MTDRQAAEARAEQLRGIAREIVDVCTYEGKTLLRAADELVALSVRLDQAEQERDEAQGTAEVLSGHLAATAAKLHAVAACAEPGADRCAGGDDTVTLFSRLQKLNKEATPPEWRVADRPTEYVRIAEPIVVMKDNAGGWWDEDSTVLSPENAALIVECRNSLPAVLNLIEAAQRADKCLRDDFSSYSEDDWVEAAAKLREAVAVFVSGQEEPR